MARAHTHCTTTASLVRTAAAVLGLWRAERAVASCSALGITPAAAHRNDRMCGAAAAAQALRRGAVRRGPRVDSDVIVLAQIAGVADGRRPAAAARWSCTSMPLLRAPRSHLAVPALSVVDSDEIPDLAIRRRRVRVPGRQTRGRCGVDGDSCRHDARPFNPRPVPQILMERKTACLSITPKDRCL